MGKRIRGGVIAVVVLSVFPRSISQPPPLPLAVHLPVGADSIATNLDDYIWPTEAPRRITSLFSEYRRTHFHGGIDVGTRRTTGYKVFAARDGYVSRIIVSPTGYGKMLWVRHPDGYFTTYAHLKGFNHPIEQRVRAEQHRLGRYPVIIECTPVDFPVRQGDVIAYTGDTGTGSAHLHFEIRDPQKNFINPLLCSQLRHADDVPPMFRALAVSPLDERSVINGRHSPEIYRFKTSSHAAITLDAPIFAWGKVGFALYARDRATGLEFTTGIYSYRLLLNDSLLYHVTFNRAPSSDDNQVGLHYDYYLMEDEPGRFEKLYTDSPNRLPFSMPRNVDAGVLDSDKLSPGKYRFTIEASDIAGNNSTLTGTLIIAPPPELQVAIHGSSITFSTDMSHRIASAGLYAMNLSGRHPIWTEQAILRAASPLPSSYPISKLVGRADVLKVVAYNAWGTPSLPRFLALNLKAEYRSHVQVQHLITPENIRVTIRTAGLFTSLPSVALVEGAFTRKLNVIPVEHNAATVIFRPLERVAGRRTILIECEVNGVMQLLSHSIDIYPLVPDTAHRYALDGGNLIIESEPGSVFKPVFMEVTTLHRDRGTLYTLAPQHTVLDKGIRVAVKSTGNNSGLYFARPGSRMRFVSREEQDGMHSGNLTRSFGDVAVLTDTRPPYISQLALPRTRNGSISFRVADDVSGVEYNELKLYINGVPVIPEIDGEHRRVVYQLEEPLKRGTHTLTILLKDRMGNSSEVHRTFRVR